MEPHRYARTMQEEFIREIEAARPAFVVFVNENMSWLVRPQSERLVFEWSGRFLSEGYVHCGSAFIEDGMRTEVYWDDALAQAPKSNPKLAVFRRKEPRRDEAPLPFTP
jgi:hypothetical protein